MIASGVVFKEEGGAGSRRRPEDQTNAQPGDPNPDERFILPDSFSRTKAANLSQICGPYVMRQAGSESKNNKNYERSRNVVENKQNADILPAKSSDILCKTT